MLSRFICWTMADHEAMAHQGALARAMHGLIYRDQN